LSLSSVASIRTILPEYSIVPFEEGSETDESPTLSTLSPGESDHAFDSPEHQAFPRLLLQTTSTHRQSAMPPRYSMITATPRSGGINHIEYSFPLGGGHKSWATLYTFTQESVPGLIQGHRSAKRNIPRFFGGGDITGMVELNLEGTQTIQQIILTVCHRISSHHAWSR
jgi:hypothetical protein